VAVRIPKSMESGKIAVRVKPFIKSRNVTGATLGTRIQNQSAANANPFCSLLCEISNPGKTKDLMFRAVATMLQQR
jgi:hypothetical protein